MTDSQENQLAFEQILKNLIDLLPSSYNKEVTDTNYYKMLRAFALQLADAKIEIQQIGENTYLETANADSIYNNFGVMVKLSKKPDWDDEKYRGLIKGVMQSLLKGPNKQSLVDGFKLFTNFKVNIYELYKDYQKLDPTAYSGYNPKFTFALEIEKPIDAYVDQESLIRDANYVVNIIKPAHTLSLNIITIIGDENYRRYYRIDKKIGKIIEDTIERKINQQLDFDLDEHFNEEAFDYSELNGLTLEQAKDELRQISNNLSVLEYEQAIENLAQTMYNDYLSSIDDGSIVVYTIDDFRIDARMKSRGVLELKWIEEMKNQYFKEDTMNMTKQQIDDMINSKKEEIIKICDNDYFCDPYSKSDLEWYKEALDLLKTNSLRNRILQELGGLDKVKSDCSAYAETFRNDLEKAYITNPPYYGMDKMVFESDTKNTEGVYGWNHFDYKTQFITSINKNKSKIGGARLIGPRYTLNDFVQIDINQTSTEQADFAFQYKNFTLNQSLLDGKDLLTSVEVDDVEEIKIDGLNDSVNIINKIQETCEIDGGSFTEYVQFLGINTQNTMRLNNTNQRLNTAHISVVEPDNCNGKMYKVDINNNETILDARII